MNVWLVIITGSRRLYYRRSCQPINALYWRGGYDCTTAIRDSRWNFIPEAMLDYSNAQTPAQQQGRCTISTKNVFYRYLEDNILLWISCNENHGNVWLTGNIKQVRVNFNDMEIILPLSKIPYKAKVLFLAFVIHAIDMYDEVPLHEINLLRWSSGINCLVNH